MKVSVIIPLFNREGYIKKTIQSILKQEYSNWEAIIVDDGSTDGSVKIVNKLASFDSRIKLFKRTPDNIKGACSCRNLGLSYSSGEYVIFLDSDDLLEPSCLSKRVAIAERERKYDFWVFQGAIFTDDPYSPVYLWNIESDRDDIQRFLTFDGPWSTIGVLWRKDFIIKNKIAWDTELHLWQDIDFHLQAILLEPKYKIFWELPYDYLVRATSRDSLSRINYNRIEKISSRIYFGVKYFKLLKSKPFFLRTLLLHVLSSFLKLSAYKEMLKFLTLSKNMGVINNSDFIKILTNVALAKISYNRIKILAFPNPYIKKLIDSNQVTLHKIKIT